MNRTDLPPPDQSVTVAVLNRTFVGAALARFAALHLAEPSGLFESLNGDLRRCGGATADDWSGACHAMAQWAPQIPGPLGRLLRDYRLQMHEWFMLALCGEVEASHTLDLVLAELQSPDDSGRPGLHLLQAMTQSLFDVELPPLVLASHPLLRDGLLELLGDGPLPTRHLAMPPELWTILAGDLRPGRRCRLLPDKAAVLPAALARQMPELAHLLRNGTVRGLIFRGPPEAGREAAAALAAHLQLVAVEVQEQDWAERPALAAACRYGGWLPVLALQIGPGETAVPATDGLALTPLVVVAGRDGAVQLPDALEVELPALARTERRAVWRQVLGEQMPDDMVDVAVLSGADIRAVAERVLLEARSRSEAPSLTHLRSVRSRFGTERLRLLAQPVTRHVSQDALVLPEPARSQFQDLVTRCRRREKLWQGLGATLAEPSLGVRALFAGESGAGKTLAASRLATELGAPLFRVDLAAVMNKYVGESEKNLGRVLDEAVALDAILLMDEADALFGRRGEGKDGGERYADMLTNFLLTRIENHPGIVVLTTNARNRIDSAFSRRFDTVIEFPQPGVEERYRLWHAHLGSRAPDERACRMLAAYCELAGGHIRNVVLQAAALSGTSPDMPLSLTELIAALKSEYRKLGRTPPPQIEQLKG
jgi:hypothetical protein